MEQYQTALECVERMVCYLVQHGEISTAERCLVAADESNTFSAKALNTIAQRAGISMRWVEQR